MSDCARCSVSRTMVRRTDDRLQVIELERELEGVGPSFEIWVQVKPGKVVIERGDPRCIIYRGKMFLWVETVFSKEHSKDEDCDAVGRGHIIKLTDGFPPVLKWEDVQLIQYSHYLGDNI